MNDPLPAWSATKRVAFRFAGIFLGLICVQVLLLCTPLVPFENVYWRSWHTIVVFLSAHLLRYTPVGTTASSDSDAALLMLFWWLVLALLGTAVWSARSRAGDYRRGLDRLRTLVRYSLATAMISYALNKVFKLQFFFPSPVDLTQTFAGSSPMGLVWRFMGYSTPYTIFGGVLELVGALLILWRRTTTLGALVICTVMLNVVMLNVCYDIPVKNFSIELWSLSIFLLVPEMGRLFSFLVLHRAVPPEPLRPYRLAPRPERARLIVKGAWLIAVLGLTAYRDVGVLKRLGDDAPKPALWGLYDVEELQRDDKVVPLLMTDSKLWQAVAFGRNWMPYATIITADGERHMFDLNHDEPHGTVTLDSYSEDSPQQTLAVRKLDATHLELSGKYYGETLKVRLRLHDLARETLLSRRMHWIDNNGGYWR